MALVSPQTPSVSGGALTIATPAATTLEFVPGQNVYYLILTGATAITATVVVPCSQYGQARPDIAHSIGTSSNRLIGPLVNDLADPVTSLVTITLSATTNVTAAAFTAGSA
jgi:hypothetical protein